MDVELQATCSALGYLEGNVYVKEPDCLETVKDLIRFLRRDSDTCDIRRQLGHAKIVQNDLIPLFKGYSSDKPLFETIIKLLVNLTQPVAACFNNQIPDEKTLRNFCLEIETHLQDTKEAFVDDEVFGVVTDKIKDILKLDWESRREEDYLQLERLFILVRNVLMIPPDPDRELRTDDDATVHDQILWASHTSGLEDLILYVASSDRERSRLCMHIMEIISLMFKEHEVETLAFAGVQRSMSEKEKDQRELELAREKEKAIRKANVLKYSARHSRFGGTFVMKNIKSITDSDVIYHKPLCEVDRFSYDDGKVPKKKSKNLAPVKTYNNKRRSTLSMRLSLKEFCVQFLMNAYNPLMRAVKDALNRSKSEDHDETYYLWAMRYFMEFCRLHCKRVDLVSETMSMAAFHYIYIQLCTYYENVALGKSEEAKTWGQRSHLALKAYQELLKTLDFMTKSKDSQIVESAKVIQSNVFYMVEYRDIFVTLLKKFKESKISRSYLRDLVESTHIFLKMLEMFSKGNRNLVTQKKGKKSHKKKKSKQSVQESPPLSEDELTVMWENDLSEQLMSLLMTGENIPTDVSPFDAASDFTEDEQRVKAMLRIQSSLRDKNLADAIAVLRAARDVWPEGDGFGSDSGQLDGEVETLRVIFMADLPRPASQAMQEDAEADDELNEELQDEMDDVRRDEHCFDFKLFISDFAHPNVIKTYAILLNEFTENSDAINHCVVKMFHRIGHDLGYVGMMFQASIFHTFSKLFFGPLANLERCKEIRTFACWVVRQFTQVASINNKVFVDILFWKSKTEALAITGDYDFRPKSKAKVAWSEHDADELACLFEKYKDMIHPELDTAALIMQELTSDHSRMQVLRELKNQGLINSAKDIKRKSVRSPKWTEDHLQELRDVVELHKDAYHPIVAIMEHLSFDKSKPAVIKKILELELVTDKSELKKKRKTKSKGGGKKKGNDSSDDDDDNSDNDDDNDDDDSSDECERLFTDTSTKRQNKRNKSSRRNDSDDDDDDDDDDYHEGDSDVDEDVMLLLRQSVSGIGDYVMRLVENGYKQQIAWIQSCLRLVADDRQEGMCIATPLVPLTEENETAMEDEIFLVFLRSIGITPPANEQEMFWRIPKEYTVSDLKTIVDGLNHDESGVAANAASAQEVVSRVFPPTTSSSSKSDAKKKKRKEKSEKKKTNRSKYDKDNAKPKSRKRDKNYLSDDDNANDDHASDDNDGISKSSVTHNKAESRQKDDDTSDSGLDLEIEAMEKERIRKEKESSKNGGERQKKGKLATQKERKDLLTKIKEKRNKRKRKPSPVHLESGEPTDPPSIPTEEGDNLRKEMTESPEQRAKPSVQGRSGKKNKGKRLKLLESDSDSDLNLNLPSSPHCDQDNDDESQNPTSKTNKRILQSDSESGEEMNQNDERTTGPHFEDVDLMDNVLERQRSNKGIKRLKMILSDDAESDRDGENHNDDHGVSNADIKGVDSDKENGNEISTFQDRTEHDPTALDDSLHLRFDESSGEDDNRLDDVNENCSDKDDIVNDRGGKSKNVGKDSFPATLMTQTLGSDDEDDHVPLRSVMNNKRAVISDDDDDD